MKVLTRSRRPAAVEVEVPRSPDGGLLAPPVAGSMPIASVTWRHRAQVAGRVRSVTVLPWAGVPTLECTLFDQTGGLTLIFLGRRAVAGIEPGSRLAAEGMVGQHRGRLAMLNPRYEVFA